MHLKRWLTAIVALPLLILLIARGGAFLFGFFICIVALIALLEFYNLVFKPGDGSRSFQAVGLACVPLIIYCAGNNFIDGIYAAVFLNFFASALIVLKKFQVDQKSQLPAAKQLMGFVYICLPLSFFVILRNGTDGVSWVFLLLLLVAAADTGAYYAGTYLGRHKLCPSVSPGKTVEGFIGGVLAAIVVGSVAKFMLLPGVSFGFCLLLFLAVSIVGPLGDLFESTLKRSGNIKDSGKILPGHGGILDRIDALLFSIPVAYFFKVYLM